MKWFAETTEWTDAKTPNHIYLLDDGKSKMFAYKPFGTGRIQIFKNPIRIDVRGRKFKINSEQFETTLRAQEPEGRSWTVKGSKGDEYQVTEINGNLSCTCSGFRFRNDCKHVKSIQS